MWLDPYATIPRDEPGVAQQASVAVGSPRVDQDNAGMREVLYTPGRAGGAVRPAGRSGPTT